MGIKVFVSTIETQGQRQNDYCFVPADELLMPQPSYCSSGTVDDLCGCRRGMSGTANFFATSTMMVAPFNGDVEDLTVAFAVALANGGYTEYGEQWVLNKARAGAAFVYESALAFQVGAVVEFRDGTYHERQAKPVVEVDADARRVYIEQDDDLGGYTIRHEGTGEYEARADTRTDALEACRDLGLVVAYEVWPHRIPDNKLNPALRDAITSGTLIVRYKNEQ